MHRLLLVEDDDGIAAPLERALSRDDFDVTRCSNGVAALSAIRNHPVDIVVLDLTLPDIDGLEVCRAIRDGNPTLPIVMLTARAQEVDIVVGFDAGADDYVTKPFSLAELTARLHARLRQATPTTALVAGPVSIDRSQHLATLDGVELQLSPKEFDLLGLLVSEAGRVVSRHRLMTELWDTNWHGSTRTLDMHVSTLRRKLGDDPEHPRFIITVRGVGFRFEAG